MNVLIFIFYMLVFGFVVSVVKFISKAIKLKKDENFENLIEMQKWCIIVNSFALAVCVTNLIMKAIQ